MPLPYMTRAKLPKLSISIHQLNHSTAGILTHAHTVTNFALVSFASAAASLSPENDK